MKGRSGSVVFQETLTVQIPDSPQGRAPGLEILSARGELRLK